MFRSALRLLPFGVLAFAMSTNTAAQTIDRLAGSWTLDRTASTFGPGDPGAERVDIFITPTEVTVRRFFRADSPGADWTLPLDGSAPPPPRRGSALVIAGKLVITHERAREVVKHVYTVEGDTLSVDRSIHTISGDTPDFTHTMVFTRSRG